MADDTLRIVARVEDQFTGPLGKLKKDLGGVADETKRHGATWKKEWAGVREEAERFRGVLGGFTPVLSAIGMGGFGAALSLGGVATALRGFTSSTRDLGLMAGQIGLTTNQLRTLSELGGKVGVSADTMKGAINQFAGNMVDLRQRWGQAYGELKNMNLGRLAEDLVNAPNMEAAIERAMEGLKDIPDPQKRARVSMMLFGTPDVGMVAASLGEPVKQALRKLQADLGEIDKETEERAKKFEERVNRLYKLGEKVKLGALGPALGAIDRALDGADQNGLRGNEQAVEKDLTTRRDRKQARIDFLREHGASDPKAEEKIKRLTDEVSKLSEQLRLMREGGGAYQPSSFGGSGPLGGSGSMIQKAAWGGFGGSDSGGMRSRYPVPDYDGAGGGAGSGGSGGSGLGSSGDGGGRGRGGARDVPDAPDIGGGMRGRPFGSKGPIDGSGGAMGGGRTKKGPVGIPYEANDLKGALGINDAQWGAFREGLTDLEGKRYEQVGGAGGRFSGRYQFGPREIAETARQLGEASPSRAQFLGDKAMQERFMERYTLEHHKYLERNSPKYREMSPEKKLEILGYAHNQGAGRGSGRVVGALGYLESGRVGHDGFGTAGTRYFDPIRRRLAQMGGGKGSSAVAGAQDATPWHQRKGYVKGMSRLRDDEIAPATPPDDGFRQTPWTKVPAIGGKGALDPEHVSTTDLTDEQRLKASGLDDATVARLMAAHNRGRHDEREARSRAHDEARRTGDYRGAFVGEMRRRSERGERFGRGEDEMQDGPSFPLGAANRDMRDEADRLNRPDDDGTSYAGRLDDGTRLKRKGLSEFTPDRELSLDEIRRKYAAPKQKVGDALMDRFYGRGAPEAGPAMQMPGGAGGSASKGKLDIHLHGFPEGARARASMDDLFKETSVKTGKSQMNMDRV